MMLSTVSTPRPLSIDPLNLGPLPSKLPLQKLTPIAATGPLDQLEQPLSISFPQQESIGVEMSDSITTPTLCHTQLLFENLPADIHEAVLDHLFGVRAATLSSACPGSSSATSCSKALRHPGRKAL